MDLFLKLLSYYNNQDNNQTYYRIIDYILHKLQLLGLFIILVTISMPHSVKKLKNEIIQI